NSEPFRNQLAEQRRTTDDIRGVLPADAALVDILQYLHAFPGDKAGHRPFPELHFAAFIVRPGKPVERVELGPVSPIAAAIEAWRRNFGASSNGLIGDPGQELRRLVWDKLEPHLDGVKLVLISPDGATARFPWPALPG